MEFVNEGKWGNSSNLFFDEYGKCAFFIHQNRLTITNLHNFVNLSPYSTSFNKGILRAAIDETREILLCQFKPRTLKFFALKEPIVKKVKLQNDVIGFQTARNRAVLWDICVITKGSLEFVRLEEDFRPVVKKVISLSISYYHFDVISGIIVVYAEGNSHLYSCYQKKILFLSKFRMENDIGELPGVNNILTYVQPQLDSKSLMLASIYSKVYLLHLDGFQGLLTIYKKDSIKHRINIEPGAYTVKVIDNLIILQNFGSQESTIIDWHSDPIMFKLSHRGSFEINPTLISVFHDFSFDLTEKVLKRLKLSPFSWVAQMPNVQYAILFLMRRNAHVEAGLLLLKTAISERQSINTVIKAIVHEENVPKISQEHIYTIVFSPCFRSGQNIDILASALLCYVKELISKEIDIELQVQMIVVRALTMVKSFAALQDLFTYQILSDSKELAMLLIELENKKVFPYGLLLGIDMLNRLKMHTLVMDVLIANGEMVETMNLLNTRPCPGYDLSKLHKDTNDLYTNTIISEFLKDNIY